MKTMIAKMHSDEVAIAKSLQYIDTLLYKNLAMYGLHTKAFHTYDSCDT